MTLLTCQCSLFLQSSSGWGNLLLNILSKNSVNSQRASLSTKNGIRDEICSLETAIFMHNLTITFPETSHFAVFETARLRKLLYTRKGLHENASLCWNENRVHVRVIVFMKTVNRCECWYREWHCDISNRFYGWVRKITWTVILVYLMKSYEWSEMWNGMFYTI